MKIAVCMKQVPAASEGDMDKETGVLIRSGLAAIANVYDLAALEAALQIKESCGEAQIDVFTMGPAKAESVLREAFAMGADRGYLICDCAFAGADVLATSYTLMQAVFSVDTYNIILCGRQTTDGDTAQVSGALARWLHLPHINWVTKIGGIKEGVAEVTYHMDGRMAEADVKLPALLSVEKDAFIPRMPSLKLKISGKKKEIPILTLADFADQDPEHYGLTGSATRVFRIFPPERTSHQDVIRCEAAASADYMMEILEDVLVENGVYTEDDRQREACR